MEFLSQADDVRDFIGLFVENNEINYEKASQIISNFIEYIFKII